MGQKLIDYIAWFIDKATKKNLILVDSKDIPYGQQLKFSDGKSEIPLNIYFSKRKGISVVPGGNKRTDLFLIIDEIINDHKSDQRKNHSWSTWVGTDESGKGDFFGSLVVCGFVMEEKFRKEFVKLGIQDSKKIKDDKITKIAESLYKKYRNNFEVIVLNPLKYNELYLKFRAQNKKLNELLAWMHGRVILNLHQRTNFEGAVIDKFAKEHILTQSLKDLKKITLTQQVRAEDDIAVACASIIARYNFNRSIERLSKQFSIELPKGASKKVISAGKEFSSRFGKARLNEVAKIHFKTYNEI